MFFFIYFRFVSDTTPAIIAVFFLFICPRENIFKGNKYSHLMDWKQLQKLFPWNVLLLLGSGLVLANGFKVIFSFV
jgi:di/tricarboxylate transporter